MRSSWRLLFLTVFLLAWAGDCFATFRRSGKGEVVGNLTIKFVSFSNTKHQISTGAGCDLGWFGSKECDPRFTICFLNTETSWSSNDTESVSHCDFAGPFHCGPYDNAGEINFSNNLCNFPNPMVLNITQAWNGAEMRIRVNEMERGSFLGSNTAVGPLIDNFSYFLNARPASDNTMKIRLLGYTKANTTLNVEVQIRCHPNYYDVNCSTFCLQTVRYNCSPITGDIICKPGWSGEGCTARTVSDQLTIHPFSDGSQFDEMIVYEVAGTTNLTTNLNQAEEVNSTNVFDEVPPYFDKQASGNASSPPPEASSTVDTPAASTNGVTTLRPSTMSSIWPLTVSLVVGGLSVYASTSPSPTASNITTKLPTSDLRTTLKTTTAPTTVVAVIQIEIPLPITIEPPVKEMENTTEKAEESTTAEPTTIATSPSTLPGVVNTTMEAILATEVVTPPPPISVATTVPVSSTLPVTKDAQTTVEPSTTDTTAVSDVTSSSSPSPSPTIADNSTIGLSNTITPVSIAIIQVEATATVPSHVNTTTESVVDMISMEDEILPDKTTLTISSTTASSTTEQPLIISTNSTQTSTPEMFNSTSALTTIIPEVESTTNSVHIGGNASIPTTSTSIPLPTVGKTVVNATIPSNLTELHSNSSSTKESAKVVPFRTFHLQSGPRFPQPLTNVEFLDQLNASIHDAVWDLLLKTNISQEILKNCLKTAVEFTGISINSSGMIPQITLYATLNGHPVLTDLEFGIVLEASIMNLRENATIASNSSIPIHSSHHPIMIFLIALLSVAIVVLIGIIMVLTRKPNARRCSMVGPFSDHDQHDLTSSFDSFSSTSAYENLGFSEPRLQFMSDDEIVSLEPSVNGRSAQDKLFLRRAAVHYIRSPEIQTRIPVNNDRSISTFKKPTGNTL